MADLAPLLLTAGEPAGVGPELLVRVLTEENQSIPRLIVADAGLIRRNLESFTSSTPAEIAIFNCFEKFQAQPQLRRKINVLDLPMDVPETPGNLDVRNGLYVLKTLEKAASLCLSGQARALVTAPLHKGVINDAMALDQHFAGQFFSGHTEYLAAQAGVSKVVMMLTTGSFRVALLTTHLPLKEVVANVSTENLQQTLEILYRELQQKFSIESPRILVCGLNPHAGEGGHLGMEEIEIIEPVIKQFQRQGWELIGPLPADTAFTPKNIERADAILAMYHDQGLPTLKHAGFGQAINITLGLPFIRTSVDHGTALDIAGSGKADPSSLRLAIKTAEQMALKSVAVT